jgi:hypothetical protein
MSDSVKEAFEAHYFSRHGGGNMTFDHANSYYLDSDVNDYWLAFQAGEQAALSANGEEKFKLLPSVRDYLYEGISDSVNSEDECPDYEFAYQLGQIVEHYSPAPPSVAVPDGLKSKVLELCSAVENDEDLPPVKYALKCGRLINEVKDMLTAAPSPDHSGEVNKLVTPKLFKAFHASLCRRFGYTHDDQYWWRDLVSLEEHIAAGFGDAKREAEEIWIDGFPPCDGDGGICHIPLNGYPDFMAIAFNNEGSLVDGCGDDIGYEIEDVEKWKPINACNLALTYQITGARDMLREAAKQFRAIGDIGHAAMCENHADELDSLRQSDSGDDSEEEGQ